MKSIGVRGRVGVFGIWMGIWMLLAGTGPAAAGDVPKAAAGKPATVTIRGSISNINDIGGYVINGSCLQLYPCETTGKISLDRDKQGMPVQPVVPAGQKYYLDALDRLVPPSGLPRTAFPDFGSFSFHKIKGLAPGGCYKICVMMLDKPYPGMVPLVGPDGKIRKIVIPETGGSGSPQDMVMDLAKETLMIPGPSNLPQDSDAQERKQPAGTNSGADFWK